MKTYTYMIEVPKRIDAKDAAGAWAMGTFVGEVVRCKECKHCKKKKGTFRGEPIFFYRCEENSRDVESDDFCSWGERSDT